MSALAVLGILATALAAVLFVCVVAAIMLSGRISRREEARAEFHRHFGFWP